MPKKETIEAKVADAILQKPVKVKIVGDVYEVAPPTPATLFLVSKLVSYIPTINGDSKNVINEVLKSAKDSKVVSKIVATMILGAKRINEHNLIEVTRSIVKVQKKKWWQKELSAPRLKVENEKVRLLELDYLSQTIQENLEIVELRDILVLLLGQMQLADFFAITSSLSVANLLKSEEEEETKKKAHGASSSAGRKH